jgi:hypothetical protein
MFIAVGVALLVVVLLVVNILATNSRNSKVDKVCHWMDRFDKDWEFATEENNKKNPE